MQQYSQITDTIGGSGGRTSAPLHALLPLTGLCSQTGRTLEHRLKEHRRALASGNTAQSAVAEHAVEQIHVINWNEAEVVACHRYYRQRCALEMWHICTEAQTMNHDAGPLPSEYGPLIHQSCP